MIWSIIAALAVITATGAAWLHGYRVGTQRGIAYASDRHAGYTEGLIDGHADGLAERDELIARLVRVRHEVAAIDAALEPPTVWSAAVAPGGRVCAVPIPDLPDGICGMPVESEPCPLHTIRHDVYNHERDGL